MNDYFSLRKELMSLKEKNVRLSPEIVSKIIKEKIKYKKTKKIFLTLVFLSFSFFLILIFRRKG